MWPSKIEQEDTENLNESWMSNEFEAIMIPQQTKSKVYDQGDDSTTEFTFNSIEDYPDSANYSLKQKEKEYLQTQFTNPVLPWVGELSL